MVLLEITGNSVDTATAVATGMTVKAVELNPERCFSYICYALLYSYYVSVGSMEL
jgi:hypothetical protein